MNSLGARDLKRDALTLAAFLASIFVGLSVASYDPADPPSEYVYPANGAARNACGPVGAFLARAALETFGLGAFGVVGLLLLVAFALARRMPMREFLLRVLGAGMTIFSGCALIASLPGAGRLVPLAGLGGALGMLARQGLEHTVSHAGTLLLLVPALTVGLLLVTNGGVISVVKSLAQGAERSLGWLKRRRASAAANEPVLPSVADGQPVAKLLETDDFVEDENEDETPRDHPVHELKIVRTGFDSDGMPAAIVDDEVEDEEAEEYVDATEDEEGEEDEAIEPEEAEAAEYRLPDLEILDDAEPFELDDHENEIRERARLLEKTLAEFQMKVKVVQIDTGPVVTQYEIELEAGLRARKVMAMADDLAIALRAPNVRIVAPIPGKNTVGIEVPNERRAKVCLKEVMTKSVSMTAKMRLPLYLGKDVKGQPMVFDLANMPHLLIAGRTGTGKSVCLNALILSIVMTRTPRQVKMLMIDPKMVELSLYKDIPHLIHPVVTDMRKAEALLGWAVDEMEKRYDLLARVGVRHIDAFNRLSRDEVLSRLGPMSDEDKKEIPAQMPYLLVFADEMADLVMTAAKEVEGHIIRLAQKSRAVGIHLILATQKPTVDVITGLIKSNLPARIAFQVASRTDSRVVLDEMGADKLLGNGDMLFLYPGTSKIIRAQGTFISDAEVANVTAYLAEQGPPEFSAELARIASGAGKESSGDDESDLSGRDELYERAVEVIVHEQRGSVSLLQRALGIGYGRGARLIDFMAEDGIVGDYNGSQAREVLVSPEEWPEFRRARFGRAG